MLYWKSFRFLDGIHQKFSNFNYQWTKTLYQNNLNDIAFFFTFSRVVDVISYL